MKSDCFTHETYCFAILSLPSPSSLLKFPILLCPLVSVFVYTRFTPYANRAPSPLQKLTLTEEYPSPFLAPAIGISIFKKKLT